MSQEASYVIESWTTPKRKLTKVGLSVETRILARMPPPPAQHVLRHHWLVSKRLLSEPVFLRGAPGSQSHHSEWAQESTWPCQDQTLPTPGRTGLRHCPLQVTQDWVSPFLPVSISLCSYPFPVVCSLAKLCPTLQNPVDWSPPGSFLHGISQARILEWVAVFFSERCSWTRDGTHVFCIGRPILYHWATWEAHPSP